MIRLLELYPEHLNLNGDRGNLLVLQKRLEWASVDAQTFTHRIGQPMAATAPDFVLLGHGSAAAWRQVYSDLVRIWPTLEQWMQNGTQLLAVSSGFAAMHGLLPALSKDITRVSRVSKFEISELDGLEVVGYKNSDLDLPSLSIEANFIGTLLHGPILAKNEQLADSVIAKIFANKEIVVSLNSTKMPNVSDYAKSARDLAQHLANE